MCKKGLEFIKTVAKYMSETNGYDRLMKNVSKILCCRKFALRLQIERKYGKLIRTMKQTLCPGQSLVEINVFKPIIFGVVRFQ